MFRVLFLTVMVWGSLFGVANVVSFNSTNGIILSYLIKVDRVDGSIVALSDEGIAYATESGKFDFSKQLNMADGGYTVDMARDESSLYVINDAGGLYHISSELEVSSKMSITQNATAIAVDDGSLYIANSSGAIVVYDKVANEIERVGKPSFSSSGYINKMSIYSSKLYAIFSDGNIGVYDLSTKSWESTKVDSASALLVDGSSLYVALSDTILELDRESLAQKERYENVRNMDNIKDMAIIGERLYYASNNNSKIGEIDIKNKTTLDSDTLVGRSPLSLLGLLDKLIVLSSDSVQYFHTAGSLSVSEIKDGVSQSIKEIYIDEGSEGAISINGGSGSYTITSTGGLSVEKDSDDKYLIKNTKIRGTFTIYIQDKTSGESIVLIAHIVFPLEVNITKNKINVGDGVILEISGGVPEYSIKDLTLNGNSTKLSKNAFYYKPQKSGKYNLEITDARGDKKSVEFEVSNEVAITPVLAYLTPEETKIFHVFGMDEDVTITSACAEIVEKTLEDGMLSVIVKAPKVKSQDSCDLTLSDANSVVKSKIFLYSEHLSADRSQISLKRNNTQTLSAQHGTGEYTWRAEQGTLSALQGRTVIYTSPNRSGKDKIHLSDSSGNKFVIEAETTGDLSLTPTNPYIKVGEEITISAQNSTGDVTWSISDGEKIKEDSKSMTFKSPNRAGIYELIATDSSGNMAVSLATVYNEVMKLSISNTNVTKGAPSRITISGGVAPYVWSTTHGYLSSYEGRSTSITPTSNIGDKVVVEAVDSVGNIAILELFVKAGDVDSGEPIVDTPMPPSNSITIKKGWNLIGNPQIESFKTNSIKEANVVWIYENRKWINNPEIINSCQGFWVYANGEENIAFDSTECIANSSLFDNGWNLIGAGSKISNPLEFFDANIVWSYSGEGWSKNPSILNPGDGFWIYRLDE